MSLTNEISHATPDAPKERAVDGQLWDIYNQLREQDRIRAQKRAMVQGLVDGNAPWDPAKLKEAGMADRTNLNFMEFASVIQDWEDAFHDLALMVPHTYDLTPRARFGENAAVYRDAICEEIDVVLKGWFGWEAYHQALASTLVVHGYGAMYFQHETSWQCRSLRQDEILIPDNFDKPLDQLPLCALGPFTMDSTDLYRLIRSPEAVAVTKKMGWDEEAIKKALLECANRGITDTTQHQGWEQIQTNLQRGNIGLGSDNKLRNGCKVVHLLVKEYDETVSKYIIMLDTNNQVPLLRKPSAANKITDIVSFYFLKGGKTNFHEVRGVGRDGFAAAAVINRLACRAVDEADEAMTPTYKAGPGGTDGREKVMNKGRVALIPSNWDAMPEKRQGTSAVGQNALRAMKNTLASTSKSPTLTQAVMRDSTQPRSAAEIQASQNMGQDVRVTMAELFYVFRDFFLANLYRRLMDAPMNELEPGFKEQEELFRRLQERGLTHDIWNSNNWRVKSARALGGGSKGARQGALSQVGQIYSRLDTAGQREWDREWIAVNLGDYERANAFMPPVNRDELPSADRSWAEVETSMLLAVNFQINASPDQPARLHLLVHVPAAVQIVQEFKQTGDPSKAPSLMRLTMHLAQHVDHMAKDERMEAEAQQYMEQVNQLVDAFKEMDRQLGAAREAQQKQAQSEQQRQIELEAARLSGATEAEMAVKLEKVHADTGVKMKKAADATALKEKKQADDFVLAMRKLDNDLRIKQEESRAKSKPAAE